MHLAIAHNQIDISIMLVIFFEIEILKDYEYAINFIAELCLIFFDIPLL